MTHPDGSMMCEISYRSKSLAVMRYGTETQFRPCIDACSIVTLTFEMQWSGRDFCRWAIFSFFRWFWNFLWAISYHSTQTFDGPFSRLMGLWRMAPCLPNHWRSDLQVIASPWLMDNKYAKCYTYTGTGHQSLRFQFWLCVYFDLDLWDVIWRFKVMTSSWHMDNKHVNIIQIQFSSKEYGMVIYYSMIEHCKIDFGCMTFFQGCDTPFGQGQLFHEIQIPVEICQITRHSCGVTSTREWVLSPAALSFMYHHPKWNLQTAFFTPITHCHLIYS